MKQPLNRSHYLTRRNFLLNGAQAAVGVAAVASVGRVGAEQPAAGTAASSNASAASAPPNQAAMPYGMIGKVKISRLLLGGNLVAGYMHCRDLKYVPTLFRAYVTEEKLMETFHLAEQHGVNTVFESGAEYVQKYNQRYDGHLQIIPHIEAVAGRSDSELKTHIQQQVDRGAVALYVWGVSADKLMQAGAVHEIARAVEFAKATGLPVGVGSHSLQVPIACEKHRVPCDFYVKTFHSDDYPSATPKALRKEYMWLERSAIFNDNMWCIDPEETIAFMKTVTKPWVAFKVLAAGAMLPRQAFPYAFSSGADFIAVGMFDFQIKEDCELVSKVVRLAQKRERPWCV
jgi:hypothetical protein